MGYRWRHSMPLGSTTRSYSAVEYPSRQNFFTTENLTHDFKPFSLNATTSYSHIDGDSSSTESRGISAYITTLEQRVLGAGTSALKMTSTFGTNQTDMNETYNGQVLSAKTNTQSVGLRFFTPEQRSRRLSLSDSFSYGYSFDRYQNRATPTTGSTLGLTDRMSGTTTAGLTYNWTYNPLNRALEIENGVLTMRDLPNLHRFGGNFSSASRDNRWDFSALGDITEPTKDLDSSLAFNYRFNTSWRIGLTNTVNRVIGTWYRDYAAVLGIRVGQREADISYSVIDHYIRFNLDSSRF